MNATEDIDWLDMPSAIDSSVERLKAVKAVGLNAGLDFHGRLHRPMAKQLAKALEPHRPLFIEEPILVEHPEALKQLAGMTSIPIALGERLYHRWDVKPFLENGLIDILQPDIAHAVSAVSQDCLLRSRLTFVGWNLRDEAPGEHGRGIRCRNRSTLSSWSDRICRLPASFSLGSELRHTRDVVGHALQQGSG